MIQELYYKLRHVLDRIQTDSRNLKESDIFLALKGEKFDANEFAQQALDKGADFVIVDKTSIQSDKIIKVEDTYQFLVQLSRLHREQLNTKVIALTGTNGKTTTKEILFSIFNLKYKTLSTKGNLNNHIGVPLTLLNLKEYHEYLILEMGANKPGDINELCEIANPDYGLITNIGKAHLEGFGSESGVIETKTELFNFLQKRNGKIFYNLNSLELKSLKNKFSNIVSYGNQFSDADYEYNLIKEVPNLELIRAKPHPEKTFNAQIFGHHNYENIIAAMSVAQYFNIDDELIQQGISSYEPKNMRSQIMRYHNNTLVLDAYNANPSSMRTAIESFGKFSLDSKWLILGSMAELGKFKESEHIALVDFILKLKMERIILVGSEFEFAKNFNEIQWFGSVLECKEWFNSNIPENKYILIKASRSVALEKLVID